MKLHPSDIRWHALDQMALERHVESEDKAMSEAAEEEKKRRKHAGGGARLPLPPSEESEP